MSEPWQNSEGKSAAKRDFAISDLNMFGDLEGFQHPETSSYSGSDLGTLQAYRTTDQVHLLAFMEDSWELVAYF